MSTKRTTRQKLLDAVRDAAEHYARTQTPEAIAALRVAAGKAVSNGASAKAVSDATVEGVARAEAGPTEEAAPEPKAKPSRPRRASVPKARTSRPAAPVALAEPKRASRPSRAKPTNPFSGMPFSDLSKIAGQMIRGEYDYSGKDFNTHFMDLTAALMEHHDQARDQLMRETIRSLVGRLQEVHGYGPGGGVRPPRRESVDVRAEAEDAERRAAEAEAPVAKESEAAPGTPEAVAEEVAAEVIAESPAPILPTEIAAAAQPEVEVRVSGPEPGAGGGWEGALSTKLAATRCCFCARALRDPQSIERGYGPECAENYVMPARMPVTLDEPAAVRALNLMPPLLRGSMERIGGNVDDRSAAWRADPSVRRQMVSTALYIGALAVSFGADQTSVVRAKIDSSKQVLASLQQMAHAFGYDRCAQQLATRYVERLEGNAIVFSRGYGPGQMGVHVPFSQVWLDWCRGNRDVFTGSKRDGSRFIRVFREEKLGHIANALRGCFGDTICIDADGNMVPLPSMHIEAEAPGPAEDVTADEVKVIQEVQPYAVPEKIKLGDIIRVDGQDLPVFYINPERQFVGLGKKPDGRYQLLKSFADIKQVSGREVASELYKEVARYTQEIGVQAPPAPTAKATARPIPVLASGETLDPHQILGVEFIDGRGGRVILADEQGLGKTVTATVCIDTPAIVACPSGIKVNWMRELLKWKKGITVSIVDGKDEPDSATKRADVIVVNYDVLASHVDWIRARNNKTIVADEAHYLKQLDVRFDSDKGKNVPTGSSPKRAAAFYEIQRGVPRLLLLTGTPVMNRTRELFPLLHMVDPGEWNNGYNFCIEYCGGHRTRFGFDCNGRTNSEDLFRRTNGKALLRRTVDVLNLPPKRYEPIVVSLSDDVRVKYEAQTKDIVQWVLENGGADAAARAKMAQALVKLNKLRETTAEGKADSAVEWIKRHWSSTGRPLVVMATHRSCFARMQEGVDKLNREFHEQVARGETPDMQAPIRYGSIVGGMDNRAVANVIDRFQGDFNKGVAPTLDLVFYSISLAVGTTLTRAQDMLFVERAWRPADLAQAEARIFRRGQKNNCLFAYLDAEGTIDQKLALMLKNKAQTIASVIYGVDLDDEEAAAFILGEMFVSAESMKRNPPSDPMDIVADGWATPF